MKEQKEKMRTMIGGQAIIEGIMMRGPDKTAIVVRSPDGIVVKEEKLKLTGDKYPIVKLPLIRGVVNFFSSMKVGMAALMYSADFYPEEDLGEPSKFDRWLEKTFGSEKVEKAVMGIAVALGVAVPVGLFILLPTLLAGLLDGVVDSSVARNLIEGALRLVIFIAFIAFTARTKDMQRVYSYHGAEHKTIHCYEAGLPLTVENVRKFPRQHPRCGTSFLFVVMIISILVFSVVSWSNPWIRMVLRLALLPVVVAISYEINRFVGRHDNPLTKALRAPGLWLQNLTTNEPDGSMIEVGIEALERVIPEKAGADIW